MCEAPANQEVSAIADSSLSTDVPISAAVRISFALLVVRKDEKTNAAASGLDSAGLMPVSAYVSLLLDQCEDSSHCELSITCHSAFRSAH